MPLLINGLRFIIGVAMLKTGYDFLLRQFGGKCQHAPNCGCHKPDGSPLKE